MGIRKEGYEAVMNTYSICDDCIFMCKVIKNNCDKFCDKNTAVRKVDLNKMYGPKVEDYIDINETMKNFETMAEQFGFEENTTEDLIKTVCNDLADFLIEKNRKYGDSCINPNRIRSNANAIEQILIRQDDKLNRLVNKQSDDNEDTMKDLVGYWILEQVARIIHGEPKHECKCNGGCKNVD